MVFRQALYVDGFEVPFLVNLKDTFPPGTREIKKIPFITSH